MENDDLDMPSSSASTPSEKAWWRRAAIGGLTAIAAIAAIGMAGAASGEFGRFGMGGHMMHAHMGGMGFGGRGMSHMLDEIDATPEQEEKLWAIIDAARGEMRPVFRDFRDTHEAVTEIIAAPTIDRAAAEKLRSERIAAIDQASRKMTTALIDAAEVLTPEQRAKLIEHIKERREHSRW